MQTTVLAILIVFYAGAFCASAKSWLGVWRGRIGYSALRDLTGIADRTTLRRLFGLTRPDGAYVVGLACLLRHRRAAGVMLTDIPVHLLFLAALCWAAAFGGDAPAAAAIMAAAAAHALLLGGLAVTVLMARPLPSSRGV